jgi:hypothetical protein
MIKSPQQKFSIELKATMPENSTSVELDINKKMECSISFMANAFRGLMQDDDTIRTSILLAVASIMGDDKKTKDEHVLENMLSNIIAKA